MICMYRSKYRKNNDKYKNIKNYNIINCLKHPISFGIHPDILFEYKNLIIKISKLATKIKIK